MHLHPSSAKSAVIHLELIAASFAVDTGFQKKSFGSSTILKDIMKMIKSLKTQRIYNWLRSIKEQKTSGILCTSGSKPGLSKIPLFGDILPWIQRKLC